MAKDKDRSINPAQAQRKLEKQKAVKKGKAEVQARRNEKLGRRNPERLQRQVDELKSLESSGQPLKLRDKKVLEELERDVSAIKKARVALGDKAPAFGKGHRQDKQSGEQGGGNGVLGKRRRTDQLRWREESDGSQTDESVRNIPMPKDTPPPIPPQFTRNRGSNANLEPMGKSRIDTERSPHALPPKPEVQAAKSVYESAPMVRNLRQEAVSKFVPVVVRKKQEAAKGQGRLMEPEEMDRLEREGYGETRPSADSERGSKSAVETSRLQSFTVEAAPGVPATDSRLAEEEARFERELRGVRIEDVSDEDL